LAAIVWVVIAAIAVANHGQLSKQPLGFKQIQQEGDAS
jgi:hypothetical protein